MWSTGMDGEQAAQCDVTRDLNGVGVKVLVGCSYLSINGQAEEEQEADPEEVAGGVASPEP